MIDEPQGLELVIAHLREEGECDSHGTFTVNVKVPLQKLLQVRHAQPDLFLRHLVGAAVELGARRLSARFGFNRWLIELEGVEPGVEEIRELFQYLGPAESGRGRRFGLRELALALTTLWGLPNSSIRLNCSGGEISLSRAQLVIWPHGKPGPLTLKVEGAGFGPFRKPLPRLKLDAFLKVSRWAPVMRKIQGRQVRPDLDWGSCLAFIRLQGRAYLPPIRCHARLPAIERSHDLDYSLLVALFPAVSAGAFDILDRGLAFEGIGATSLFPWRALLSTSGLPRDLLGRRLLSQPSLTNVQDRVVYHTVELIEELTRHHPQNPSVQRIHRALREQAPRHPAWQRILPYR